MAKKKQPSKWQVLAPPYSFKTIGITGTIAIALIALNVTTLNTYRQQENAQATQATKTLLTKVGLENVLGSSTTKTQTADDTVFTKRADVSYWLDVIAKRPDYRDAHIILATLAYNDHRCKFAEDQLAAASAIDPKGVSELPQAQTIQNCEK